MPNEHSCLLIFLEMILEVYLMASYDLIQSIPITVLVQVFAKQQTLILDVDDSNSRL